MVNIRHRALWYGVICAFLICSCSKSIDLLGRRCPCAGGYVCDPATNTCVFEIDASTDVPTIDTPDVPHGPTNPPVAVTAGGAHTCVLFEDGTVRCWGRNETGQLGYGNTENIGDNEHPAEAPLVSLGAKALQVSAGGYHTCALLEGGTVRCWGGNFDGQLGYGNTDNIGDDEGELPSTVGPVSLPASAIQIVAGGQHTCALLENGDVMCWGLGDSTEGEPGGGQLGYGNTNDVGDSLATLPSLVGAVSLGGKAIHIAASQGHTCAVLEDHTVRCWGWNLHGQLGYGDTDSRGDTLETIPSEIGAVTLAEDVLQISAGWDTTCALYTSENVLCWGSGLFGQTGQGNTDNLGDEEDLAATSAISMGGKVTRVVNGYDFSCAILTNGNVRCWGHNDHGQLGYGHTTNVGSEDPPSAHGTLELGGSVVDIAAGGWSFGNEHACAVLENGDVRCWGRNYFGQLGYGNTEDIGDGEVPSEVAPVILK